MLAIDNLPHELWLGRQTENGVTVIQIDVQSWLDQWPGMETVIMATRPGESAAYPAATRMDGSSIVWTVNGADTAIAGRGTAEILGLVDGVRKLSQIVRTRIKASTVATTMEPPEGAQPWVDKVINAADEIKNMTAQAETLQPGDAATASYADGKLTLGIPRGLPGEPGAKGDKGDPGPQGAPGSDVSVTAESIQSALGYTPGKTLTSENYDGQIENLFSDKITVLVNNFWRYGNICSFVLQINVPETMVVSYGVNIAKLPFATAMRCWLNNSTDYYIAPDGQYIKRNDEKIYSGTYILSAMYITNDAASAAVEATALTYADASFPVESKVNKVKAKTDTLENTTDDIVLMMADLIGGGE